MLIPICLLANGLDVYYNLDIYFHPSSNQSEGYIEGVNHVRIVNNSQTELKELYFHTAGNHDLNKIPLTEIIKVRCSHLGHISGQDSLVMKIGLSPPVQSGESVIIDISFKTQFSTKKDMYLSTQGTRKDTTIYNAISFYPVLEYYYRDGWHSKNYHNSIKPYTNFAKYDISLSVPRDILVSSSGKVIKLNETETGHVKYIIRDDYSLSFSALFARGMIKTKININGIKVEIISSRSQSKHIQKVVERLKILIPFYEEQFGNALMDKLVIGIGYDIGARVITENNYLIFQDVIDDEHVLDHELAHQWFGHSIQTDYYTETWLNESFAEYASWLFAQSQKKKSDPFTFTEPIPDLNIWADLKAMGIEDWTQFLMDVIGQKSLPPVYRPGKQINWEAAANIYSKYIVGNHALQTLQATVGDSIMKKIVYDYCIMFKGKTASTENFIQAINKYTDNQIADNFRLALTTNLKSDIEIQNVETNYNKNRVWNNKITTSFEGSWIMPIDILFITEHGDSTLLKQVDIITNNIIELNTLSPLASVVLDPNKRLFDDNRFNNRWPRRISLLPEYGLPSWETYKVYYRPRIKRDWRGNWRTGLKFSGGIGINMMPIIPAFYQNLFDLEITFSTGVPEYNWGGRINYRTPLKSTVNTYWEMETGYEYPKKWTKISFNNYVSEPKYFAAYGESFYSRLTTTFTNTEYTQADSGNWWSSGRSMRLKEKWTLFSYTSDQRYLMEAHLLGGFQDEDTFYNFGLSADIETHKVAGYIIRLHGEAGFVWDERTSDELSYRLLYVPKVWQQREGQIPLFRGVSEIEKEWQNNIFSSGFSIGWETNTVAWPMVYIDGAVVSDYEGSFMDRIDQLSKSNNVYIAAGIGLESQTMMEIGLYFPFWVSHPVGGENNLAMRMLMQWGFYF